MPRPTPLRRRRAASAPELTPEAYKHELIEAHAKQWHTHPHGSRTAMIIGIVICAVVVVAGWAMTTGKTLFSPFGSDEAFADVSHATTIFQK
ncbi:MAG TPA: hypothetical protein VMU11_01770 [Verrucomicrobiae bacterium]|nr:hypothetical protein [Verrucomicrobiae bacterium]